MMISLANRLGCSACSLSRSLCSNLKSLSCQSSQLQHERLAMGTCVSWRVKQPRTIYTSSVVLGGKLSNTKKKIVKPIHIKAKKGIKTKEVVTIHHNMTVQQLANVLNRDIDVIYEAMLSLDHTEKYDHPDAEIEDIQVIKEITKTCGYRFRVEAVKIKADKVDKDASPRPPPDPVLLKRRPPIVTIMGHVDHGKTTLLDALRHSHLVDHEFGGITQHIGAFSVKLPSGDMITFLDTPGHAAFHAMRSRGAHVTDIVILVVAADDGVMGQTVESIQLAHEFNVPIIVAINKLDKAESNVEVVKQSLLGYGVQLEDLGGDIQAVPISALKGTNLDKLQEAIIVQAELMDIKADYTGLSEATVIEAKTDPGRGKLATLLVQRGTLRKGCIIVAGTGWAKVRGMFNDRGRPVKEATPGMPVEVIGWRELPSSGDKVLELESESRAKEVVTWRESKEKIKRAFDDQYVINQKAEEHRRDYQIRRNAALEKGYRHGAIYRKERVKETMDTHLGPELAIVVKGDVDGTLEAILDVLDTYDSPQCHLQLLHYGIGPISEHDIEIAATFNGIVYGFNVPTSQNMKAHQSHGVDIRLHNVIYKMFDDITEELTKRLPPIEVKEVIGEANVQQLFIITDGKKKLPVAGCRCTKGVLQRKKLFQLIRGEDVLVDGAISSLKHFKNEVDSVKTDVECGLLFEDKSVEPEPGDKIICYEIKEMPQEIDWDLPF